MYETIRRLYLAGRLSGNSLTAAQKKGWLTQAQAERLRAEQMEAEAAKADG